MPGLKLEGFSGISPRTGPSLLDPSQAQVARNLKLQSGEIRPWRKPVKVYTPAGPDINTIYRMYNSNSSASAWFEFSGDVNVVQGPIADTSEFRVYYTGDGAPKKTNWNLATTNGTGVKPFPVDYQMLGVPAPAAAPTLAGTAGTAETRVYVYTYVNTFGAVKEESAPSPPATISLDSTLSPVTLSFSTAPLASAKYNITAIRIYRTTATSYSYVGEIAVNPATGLTSGSYTDILSASQLGGTITSLLYTPPPSDLKGLVALPNGVLAGFTGNQVWFSEPYLPHAWPSSYMMTVGATIVGLGVFGQSLVVCTTSNPYLITGTTPGAMSQEKLSLPEPCVSKRSIVGDQYGVLYASPNGVVSIAPGTQDVVTRQLLTKDEWQVYSPNTMKCVIYQNMYIMFYDAGADKKALVMTRGDNPPLISLDASAKAVFFESTTANVFVVDTADDCIYQLDADTVNNMFYEWTSKKFLMPTPVNFAVMQAYADWDYINSTTGYNAYVAGIIAANQAIWAAGANLQSTLGTQVVNTFAVNGSTLTTIPSVADSRNVNARVVGDGVFVTGAGFSSQDPVRMPANTRAYVYEVSLTGNAPFRKFAMATSIGELRQI